MSDPTTVSKPHIKRRRWLRWLIWLGAGLAVLVVLAYFVLTSSAFIKGVILPRVGSALNASVTVSDASLQPFHQLVLRNLKVQTAGAEPLVTADEVSVRYHLWEILHGNLLVDEVSLVSPTVELVENPNGTSNLDPIMKALQAKPATPTKPAAPPAAAAKPPQIDVGKLTLSNAHILKIKNYDGGHRDSLELTNVNITLTNLKNGQTAKLELAAALRVDSHPPTGAEGSLAASFNGSFNCALSPDLKPVAANGNATFAVSQAGGVFDNFNSFSTALQCDATPTEIKQLSLRFQQAGAPLGELTVAGPFDPAKMEGKLTVGLSGIDRRLLNLAAGKAGIDFGGTTVDATADVQLAGAGANISATGKFNAAKMQLTRAGQTTPTLDFSASYDVSVDSTAQTATLRSLSLAGTQNGASLLDAQLTSPMIIAWGNANSSVADAAFNLNVTGLNLADWQPFLGGAATAGNLGMKLTVTSHQAGKQIVFDLTSKLANLNTRLGSNQISHADVELSAQGQAEQFKHVTLDKYAVAVALQNQPALDVSGSGVYDLGTGAADLQVKLQATLARLMQAFPQPGMSISSGDLALNAHVIQKEKSQTVTGDLALDNFSAQMAKNDYEGYSSKFTLDLVNSPEQIQINKLDGNFSQNGKSGGNFVVSGIYQLVQKSADFKVTLSDLNENGLRPFLEPLLAGKQLTSVLIAGDISGQYRPQGTSDVKADVQVSKLVVTDPKQKIPATPLAAGLKVDASLDKQTANVRQFQITLTPTARAANQLQFSGQVDMTKPDAIQGQLKLAADSLDLTDYYDLFKGGNQAVTNTVATAPPAPASTVAGAQQEPAPVSLPLANFGFAVNIGKLFLHEIAVTNFQSTANIDGGHIVLKSCQLSLNGAPVDATADLDLSVPGYKYKVGFNAQAVPLAPLINTFQPQRTGQFGGTATATAQISGAGVTGASLQKYLTGNLNLGITNVNLDISKLSGQNKFETVIKRMVSTIVTIPDILSNPANGIASAASSLLGHGGVVSDLETDPIEVISVPVVIGDGQINLKQAVVSSGAFQAVANGNIQLAAVFTNSTLNIPISVSLSQKVAGQLQLASGTASANSAFVPLPQFLTVTGTIGNPQTQINKVALLSVVVRSGVGGVLKSLTSPNPSGGNILKSLISTNTGNLLNQFLRPRSQ